ncbi:MAG: hypothetical protein RLZZ200_184 [Pseudomonadota bacterium]|jgi:anti-sigma factor RsiW
MDDAFDRKLRQRFAQMEHVGAEASFLAQHRLRRDRLARREALLRGHSMTVLLLVAASALYLLAPWLGSAVHETGTLVSRLLQGEYSLPYLILMLALGGVGIVGGWAWSQALRRG